MNTLLRSLIVWLLLLAVPYQGMAAAAMLACAPSPAKAEHQVHQAELPPCHEAAPPAADAETDQKPVPHAKAGTCASCSACGISTAAIPARLPALAVHAPATVSSPASFGHLPSVHLDQPERPPRHRLA